MIWILALIAAVATVACFFAWANRRTARRHARFQRKDVEEALAELVSPDTPDHDAWDLFLAWPIDDPYLESIRRRCLTVVRECAPGHLGEDISKEGAARVTALLEELRGSGQLLSRQDSTLMKGGSRGSGNYR